MKNKMHDIDNVFFGIPKRILQNKKLITKKIGMNVKHHERDGLNVTSTGILPGSTTGGRRRTMKKR